MNWLYRLTADVVVLTHLSYVLFVVVGQLLVLVGWARRWEWVRNRGFRGAHLMAILVVVLESWIGITCPLTTLEQWLRTRGGQAAYQGDFVGNLAHDLLFVDWPPWVFTVVYSLFGLLVVMTLWILPPRWRLVPHPVRN
jgi:hypothetical protein